MTSEYQKMIAGEPIQLLDVRTPTEFRRGHIKNAKNVPLTEIGSYTPATNDIKCFFCRRCVRTDFC